MCVMCDNNYSIMSWNVRGLNLPAKRVAVNEIAQAHKLAILSLQETKIETWSAAMAVEIGGSRLDGCVVLPATGTRGGAAIFWSKSVVNVISHIIGIYSITAKVQLLGSSSHFWMTMVYGPNDDAQRVSPGDGGRCTAERRALAYQRGFQHDLPS